MVHAVGSGVGLTAVQLARAFGATPFGTARTADKIDRARALGLEDGIVVRDDLDPIVAAAERWTSGHGIDVTLELVGGDYATIDVKIAARFGRIVLIGTVAGGSATIPLGVVMGKRLTIRGTVLRARSLDEKAAATAAFALDVVPLLAAGTVRPIIDRVFPLAQATDAHRLLESNSTFGKIVLTVE
jgi:NADPH:quinone reductase-like Zn-dependent oxidoreductase